jgi:hypothetical protein
VSQPFNAPSAADLLGDKPAGPPSAKFPNVGDSFTGTVVSEEVQQQRDYQTGDLQFWPDGKPKWQVVLTCDSTDGQQRLFIKGQMLTAAKAAMRKAGMASFTPGSKVSVTFVKYDDVNTRMKVYEVEVTKGSIADVAAEPQAEAAQPVITAEQAEGLTSEAHAALKAAGLIK